MRHVTSPRSTHHHDPGSRVRGSLLAVAGACLWGTTGTSQALLTGHHSPVAVGGLRASIAAATLMLVCLLLRPRA